MMLTENESPLITKQKRKQSEPPPIFIDGREMTQQERHRYLEALERNVRHGMNSRHIATTAESEAKVREAYRGIRDERLWRQDYRSWEEFCYFYLGESPDRVNAKIDNEPPLSRVCETKTPPTPKTVVQCVYFIECVSTQFVKIGFSDDVNRRLACMQTSNPLELRIIATIPGADLKTEKRLHRRFAASRVRENREWFILSDEIKSFIDKHTEKA